MFIAAVVALFLVLVTSRETFGDLQTLRQQPVHQDWLLAEQLRQAGIKPGDRVAVAGPPSICYWARLAQVRIAADAGTSSADALRQAGIRAIVSVQTHSVRVIE